MCFWALFFISNTTDLYGQDTKTLFVETQLNASEERAHAEMLVKIRNYPRLKKYSFVTVGNFESLFSKKHTTFMFENNLIGVEIRRNERREDGTEIRYALFDDYFGDLTLIQKGDLVFGTMDFEEKHYRIYGIAKKLSVLMEFDVNDFAKMKCGTPSMPKQGVPIDENYQNQEDFDNLQNKINESQNGKRINSCSEGNTLTIHCMSTTAALDNEPNINQTALSAVEHMNNSLINSQMYGIRAVLSGNVTPSGIVETNNIGTDVKTFISNSTAQNDRNIFKADIMILLTDGNYDNASTYGSVDQINAENNKCYAIVEADAVGRGTFAHECGHLLGGLHENDNITPSVGYDRGHKFYYQNAWGIVKEARTIMHTGGEIIGFHITQIPMFGIKIVQRVAD